MLTRIQTPTDSYERHYPEIVELANRQLEKQLWFSSEMVVALDRNTLKYGLTPEQKHMVEYILSLFVRYELQVGKMWSKVAQIFPRPEVQLAASVVEMVERAVHAEFYNQINVQLGLDKEEDYLKYKEDSILLERAEWLGKLMSGPDDILSVIIFSLTETALLFSMFSMLKSFQTNGYNLIPVIVRGTNQSAIDEDLHGMISAEIINTYYKERGTTLLQDADRYPKVVAAVHYAFEHECAVIRGAFLKGHQTVNGMTQENYQEYVKYRLNVYCERLGLPHEFVVKDCEIKDWFEKNTYAFKVPDFFTPGQGMEYEMDRSEELFMTSLRKDLSIENGAVNVRD